jgi:hypothetical protein
MRCPQCGEETPNDEWNCTSCRVNLYWAHQHYNELARIRAQQGLKSGPSTPSFLIDSHQREMQDRVERAGRPENRVRMLARRIMRGKPAKEP